MRLHSGWLAGGLLLAVVLACNTSKNSNNSNNSNSNKSSNTSSNTRPANADVYVETIKMARDNNGKAGEPTTTFAPDDHTVYAMVTLNKAKSGTQLRFVWIAADVEEETNKELKSLDYTTKSFENIVNGHLTWPQDWPKGSYRVEVYVNGVLDKTINYTIE